MQIRPLLADHGDHILDLGQSDLTKLGYGRDLHLLCQFLHTELGREPEVSDLTKPLLGEWARHNRLRGVGPATIERRRCAVRSFLSFLGERELPHAANAGDYRIPKREDPEPRFLSKEQARQLVEQPGLALAQAPDLSPRDRALLLRDTSMLILDYEIGARRSEVVDLDITSLLWDVPAKGDLVVKLKGKGKKFRLADVTYAREPLRAWLAARAERVHPRYHALFTGFKTNTRLSACAYYDVVRRWGNRIGLQVGPHLLRHSFATHLRDNGVDLTVIQLLLGHARVTTTRLYAHTNRQFMRAANQRHPLNSPDLECPTQEQMLERLLAQVKTLSESASRSEARMEQVNAVLDQLHGLKRPHLDPVSSPG